MNLVNDPWIPVVLLDGAKEKISLRDVFARGGDVRDLACNPPQRIALMRLLICVTQAALDGPEDEEDWFKCKDRITDAVGRYLDKWANRFELYGEHPFMQIPGLKVAKGKEKSLDELDCRFAKGNMSVLFDHEATPEGRSFSDDEIALALLALMNFSSCGKIGQAIWNKVTYSEPTFAAPCIDHVVTFVRGENLLATIHFNLLTKNGQRTGVAHLPTKVWGQPVWENFPKTVNDAEAFKNAGCSYLGRLVPLSRFVNLVSDISGRCIIGPTHKSFKIEHLPGFRDPWATVVSGKNGKLFYLRLDETKHMWRELGSLLSLSKTEAGNSSALSLCNLELFPSLFENAKIEIWTGGLKSGSGGGKLIDMFEWMLPVTSDMLCNTFLNKYLEGIKLAEKGDVALSKALKECFHILKVRDGIPLPSARQRYWDQLDRSSNVLLQTANSTSISLGDQWYTLLVNAAKVSYKEFCPRQTPRQIEAYALGLAKLNIKNTEV